MSQEFLRTVSAVNDETRVRILAFIAKYQKVCVCDIENSFGMIQSRISRHLKILKDAGFLDVSREGRWAYYSIAQQCSSLHGKLLEEIQELPLELPQRIRNCKVA